MVIAGEGFSIPLAGEWRAKIEETWEGARRREILPTVPIAQQFLLANSPVADLFKSPAAALEGAPAGRPVAAGPVAPASAAGGAAPSIAGAGPGAALPTLTVTLSVIAGQMKFDQTTITARPGQRVEITFNNTDDMQHNVVIFKRGNMAAYEKELFGSLNEPNAQLRGFVPDSPNVLVASRLLNARESTLIAFNAPTEPGEYPVRVLVPGTLGDDAGGLESRVKSARGDVR